MTMSSSPVLAPLLSTTSVFVTPESGPRLALRESGVVAPRAHRPLRADDRILLSPVLAQRGVSIEPCWFLGNWMPRQKSNYSDGMGTRRPLPRAVPGCEALVRG